MLGILGNAVTAVFGWFEDIIGSVSGALIWVITGIVLTMIFRYLLRPLIGTAMSDSVKGIVRKDNKGN